MTCTIANYDWSKPYDDQLPKLIAKRKLAMAKVGKQCKLDTFFWLVGNNGTGKSTLMLHILALYFGEDEQYVEGIALNEDAVRKAVSIAKKRFLEDTLRYGAYDEADASRRDPHNKFIKKTIKLLWKARVCGFLNLWCWPQLSWIDKNIVARANGAFLCVDTWNDRPRRYVFFTRKALNKITNEEKVELTSSNLKKFAKKYGSWVGRYRDYKGVLIDAYMDQKIEGTLKEIDEYGMDAQEVKTIANTSSPRNELYAPKEHELVGAGIISRLLNISTSKARLALEKLQVEGIHNTLTTSGYRIKMSDLHHVKDYLSCRMVTKRQKQEVVSVREPLLSIRAKEEISPKPNESDIL